MYVKEDSLPPRPGAPLSLPPEVEGLPQVCPGPYVSGLATGQRPMSGHGDSRQGTCLGPRGKQVTNTSVHAWTHFCTLGGSVFFLFNQCNLLPPPTDSYSKVYLYFHYVAVLLGVYGLN